jgi:FtsZ-binding cell division protein ZapB
MRADAFSPDPLPHLYRPPSMLAPMGELAAAMMPEPVIESAQAPLMHGVPEPFAESFLPTEPVAPGMPEPVVSIVADQPIAGPPRPLVRRRSSLRQNPGRSSANGTPKVVSWAMDRDWADYLTKFDHVVYAAEFAGLSHSCMRYWVLTSGTGSELEEARQKFQEEISGVQNLRLTLTGALERLRLESDTLQREESALRAHEERMVATFERLQQKEANYKERGKKKFQSFLYIHFSLMGFLTRQSKLLSMKVSALSSPPITDARAQRSAKRRHPNVKTIYEPEPIPSIVVNTASALRRGLSVLCKLYPVVWAPCDKGCCL